MATYQEIYPSEPILRSASLVRPRAADLLSVEYFEADPDRMPERAFRQHHILLNLREEPHLVENRRGGVLRRFTFAQDEVVVTPAGLESGWRWHARSKVIVITLFPERLQAFASSELHMLLTPQQLLDRPQVSDPELTATARMLLEALRLGGAGSDVMFESLARVFLIKLLQRHGDLRAEGVGYTSAYTAAQHRRVMDLVEERFASNVLVEDLARAAGVSPAHFARQFKAVIGDTPHQFLNGYRIEQATRRLADPARTLLDVALECGFVDQPHFTRVFRAMRGVTPRAWRHGDGRG